MKVQLSGVVEAKFENFFTTLKNKDCRYPVRRCQMMCQVRPTELERRFRLTERFCNIDFRRGELCHICHKIDGVYF